MIIDLNKTDKPFITKNILLEHLTDLEIFRKYLDDGDDIVLGRAMKSPLMKDTKPSFGFFQGESGEICFKDHRLGGGDFVRFVQMKFGGLTYYEALSKIATDFELNDKYICKASEKTRNINTRTDFISREELISRKLPLQLSKNRRKWQIHDIAYWESFGISVATLEKFNVEPLTLIYINNKIVKADKYSYCFIEFKDGKEAYKIYQPFNNDFKWINGHNDSVWQGWQQLPSKGKELIVTKSLKDVMSLYEVSGIPSVALQSENILPKRHVFDILDKSFEIKYSLYDNDFDSDVNWGKKFGDRIAEEFGLIPLYIDEKHKSKDFSDLVKNVGAKEADRILQHDMMLPF